MIRSMGKSIIGGYGESSPTGQSKGKLMLFALIALVGLLLLAFAGGGFGKSKGEEATATGTLLDPDTYAERVELRIEELCRGVVGNCEVEAVVSLEGGYRSVYVSDSQSSGSGYKSNTVLVGSGSSEGAILVCYENPRIAGVGIVISCKEDRVIENDIISLISAAFDIGANKIHVAFGG